MLKPPETKKALALVCVCPRSYRPFSCKLGNHTSPDATLYPVRSRGPPVRAHPAPAGRNYTDCTPPVQSAYTHPHGRHTPPDTRQQHSDSRLNPTRAPPQLIQCCNSEIRRVHATITAPQIRYGAGTSIQWRCAVTSRC
eukprot:1256633-Prymnesium_polylepis.1